MGIHGVVLLVLICGPLAGQSKDTIAAQLAASQKALAASERDKAALSAALAKVTTGAAASKTAATNAQKDSNAHFAEAKTTADTHAAEASSDIGNVQTKLDTMPPKDNTTVILAGFAVLGAFIAFLTLLVPVCAVIVKVWGDSRIKKAEHQAVLDQIELVRAQSHDTAAKVTDVQTTMAADTRTIRAELKQVHTLVNSNLTASMQGQLDAIKDSLLSRLKLEAIGIKAGLAPEKEDTDLIAEKRGKIAELQSQLDDRLKVTKQAQTELEVEKL